MGVRIEEWMNEANSRRYTGDLIEGALSLGLVVLLRDFKQFDKLVHHGR